MKVYLVIFTGDESRGVCGVATDIEHADMLVGRMTREGTVYGGKFDYYEVEVDVDFPMFPWEVAGKRVEAENKA
jgi:hypothetical protein